MAKAHALFHQGLEEVGGNESMINVENGTIQMSFFVESATAAKYISEGEGLAGEGWSFILDVESICTDFSEALFFFFLFFCEE